MTFKDVKEEFEKETKNDSGSKIMEKVSEIISEVGGNFLSMNGGELSEAQSKLAGYKFFITDYVGELNQIFESLRLEIRSYRAHQWDVITEKITAEKGRVKNKEQIENVLIKDTEEKRYRRMRYETLYFKYKLKISSIDSVLTTITQRISSLKKELEKL